MKLIKEPTKEEFEERYNVQISNDAFNYLKTFLWEICLDKDTKKFYKDLDNKKVDMNKLIDYLESAVLDN